MKNFFKFSPSHQLGMSLAFVFLFLAASNIYAQTVSSFEREEIVYSIKKFGLAAGKARLSFSANGKLGGQDVHIITFRAEGMNFWDEETIFVRPSDFYPIMVRRDINIWGKKEKITEEYLANGIVKITKEANGEVAEQIIRKEGPIDNIYSFIYRFRWAGSVSKEPLLMRLPTKDIKISIVKSMKIKAAGKQYDSYYMESDPKQYSVWFDKGEKKMPLRIDGSAGLMSTSMVMTEYRN
ncbi:MAG: hypothetical protein WC552_05690 [Candidatus Omnitrophota bacterium]